MSGLEFNSGFSPLDNVSQPDGARTESRQTPQGNRTNRTFSEELHGRFPDLLEELNKCNETDISDKEGNLKEGVPLGTVLERDGRLKPGWSVDNDGIPHYSVMRKLMMSGGAFTNRFTYPRCPQ